MSLGSLAIFSIIVAIVGLFKPIPLAALWPIRDAPGQMEFRLGHLGGAFDWHLLPQVTSENNFSLVDFDLWSEQLLAEKSSFKNCTPVIPPALASVPAKIPAREVQTTSRDLANLPAPSYELRPADSYPWTSELDELSIERLLRPTLDPGSAVTNFLGPYQQPAGSIHSAWAASFICAWVISIAGWLITRRRQRRCFQIVNYEILEYIRDLHARKADIMEKMDVTASAVESQIEELLRQIMLEKEMVCADFAVFLGEGIDQLRESLQSDVERELAQQVSEIKHFVAGLEKARQDLSSANTFESIYEALLKDIKRSREMVENLRTRIHGETESYISALALVQQNDRTLRTSKTANNDTQHDGQQPSTEKVDRPVVLDPNNEPDPWAEDARIPLEMSEAEPPYLEEWRMLMTNRGMTLEDIEHGRRVRRERIEKRRAEYSPCKFSPSSKTDRRKRRQRRSSRNKTQQVYP